MVSTCFLRMIPLFRWVQASQGADKYGYGSSSPLRLVPFCSPQHFWWMDVHAPKIWNTDVYSNKSQYPPCMVYLPTFG